SLTVKCDSYYYERKKGLFAVRRINHTAKYDDEFKPGSPVTVFQHLVLNYGPHLFIGIFGQMGYDRSRYSWESDVDIIPANLCTAENPMKLWFNTVYWFWRIAKNPDMPIYAAWQIPREVINKIVVYILHNTGGYDKHRRTVSIAWSCQLWQEFVDKLRIKFCKKKA